MFQVFKKFGSAAFFVCSLALVQSCGRGLVDDSKTSKVYGDISFTNGSVTNLGVGKNSSSRSNQLIDCSVATFAKILPTLKMWKVAFGFSYYASCDFCLINLYTCRPGETVAWSSYASSGATPSAIEADVGISPYLPTGSTICPAEGEIDFTNFGNFSVLTTPGTNFKVIISSPSGTDTEYLKCI